MINEFMLSVFVTYGIMSRGPSGKGGVNKFAGGMGIFALSMSVMMVLINLFGLYFFNLYDFFSKCCSIGPDVPRNPFSTRAAGAFILGGPISLWISWVVSKKCELFIKNGIAREHYVTLARIPSFLLLLSFVVAGSCGAHSGVGVAWCVLTSFPLMVFVASAWMRLIFIKHKIHIAKYD